MDKKLRDEVLGVLEDAEQSLRKLISRAALKRQYDELTWIVELAKQVLDIRDRNAVVDERSNVDANVTPTRSLTAPGVSRAPLRRAGPLKRTSDYPRFSAQNDRLVKTGWSKKKKGEYEHRAPKTAIERVFDGIRQFGTQKLFDVDAVTPLVVHGDDAIPSYQIYMAIGWFRDVGYLEKCGRNEYRVTDAAAVEFESLWQKLERN